MPDSNYGFGLREISYVVALIASGLTLGPFTIIVSLLVLIGWAIVFSNPRPLQRFWTLLAFVLLVILVTALLLPTVQQVRESPRHAYCNNNIKQFMIGILNKESVEGSLLRSEIRDANRVPHSWRIAVLPYIEQNSLYHQYHFDEPWDGPNNIKLLDKMPACFQCPSQRTGNNTPYKLVTGPGTVFDPSSDPVALKNINMALTIALVEDHINPVPWTQPEDLTIEQALNVMNQQHEHRTPHVLDTFFKHEYLGLSFAMLDGSTWFHYPGSVNQVPRSAFTADKSGDAIAQWKSSLEASRGNTVTRWRTNRMLSLAAYLCLVALPGYRLMRR